MTKNNNKQNIIYSQIIRVDEIIEKKHLRKFIYTSLKLKNIKIEKNDNIIYNYIKEIKSYQIIIYKNRAKSFLAILDKFSDDENKDLKIVVYENSIHLFKNGKFYFYQELSYSLSENEIQELIYGKLNLVIEDIEYINFLSANKKINHKEVNKKVNNIKKNNFPYLFFYSFFIIILTVSISIYIDINNFENNLDKKVEKKEFELKKLIESKQKDLQIISLVILFENIKKMSVKLTDLSYENKLYTLILESPKEKNLYNLMSLYEKTVKLKKIQYLPERKKYELHIQIRDN